MADRITKEQRSACMSNVSSKNTSLETITRKYLWKRGFRYICNVKRLPGSPDIVLPKYKTVIFVHGCFWHGHKGCKKYTVPKTNTEYWKKKVVRNKKRDEDVWRLLEAQGWYVIIVWECELKKDKFQETVERVEKEIRRNGEREKTLKEERKSFLEREKSEQLKQKEYEALLKKELSKRFPK